MKKLSFSVSVFFGVYKKKPGVLLFQSFSNAEELQKEMMKLKPVKIDVGAVFNARPSEHKKVANFQPQVSYCT